MHLTRKQRYENSRPLILNHLNYTLQELQSLDIDVFVDIDVHITDLLHNYSETTTITAINQKDSRVLIESIRCPICNQPIQIDEHWDCYICKCYNQKKIYDVTSLSSPKLTERNNQLSKLLKDELFKLRTSSANINKIYQLEKEML